MVEIQKIKIKVPSSQMKVPDVHITLLFSYLQIPNI